MNQSEYFPDCFYRVTVKGVCVKDGKVLLVHESPQESDKWELPGGGLDFGEDFHSGLKREIEEEMGLKVTKISDKPIYSWTHRYETNERKIGWYYSLALAFRVELENLNFTPSDECDAIKFFSKDEMKEIELCGQANEFSDIFNPQDFKDPF